MMNGYNVFPAKMTLVNVRALLIIEKVLFS